MNTPVSFELAKLLKEKCFDKRTPMVWLFSLGKQHLRELHLSLELNDCEYNAPTIADVVMWLHEKHNIWISVQKIWEDTECFGFDAIIDFNDSSLTTKIVNSPVEAYEVAILYTLTNLI